MRSFGLLVLALSLTAAAPSCKRRAAEEGPTGEAYNPVEPEPPPRLEPDLHGDPLPPGAVARLGSLRFLDRSLQHLTFTPDGKQIVANTTGGYVLWDAETGSRRHTLERRDAAWPLAISPDGTTLATAALGGEIQMWDLGARTATATLAPSRREELSGLCFVSGELLASASDAGRVVLWDLGEGSEREVLQSGSGAISALACGAGLVVWGTADGAVSSHREGAAEWKRELGRAERTVETLAVARDGKRVAVGAADSMIRIWSVGDGGTAGPPVEIQAHDDTVLSVAFSPDGTRLYSSGGDAWFREWNVEDGTLARDILGIGMLESQLFALSHDGTRIASWSRYTPGRGTEGGRFWLWDVAEGELHREPERHREEVVAIAFSPDSAQVATGSLDGAVRLWEARTGKPIAVQQQDQGRVRALRFARDGNEIWSAGSDARIRAWDPERDQVRQLLDPVGGEVTSFDVSPDLALAATGDLVGRAWTFALPGGRRLASHDRELYAAVNAVAFARDGKELVIAGSARDILVIDLASGDEAAVLRSDVVAHQALALSPDGRFMATGADDFKVRVWTTDPWQEVAVLEGHDGTVRSVAFSADGKRLASGGNDETVRIWDVEAREELRVLTGHGGAVTAVAISPDGTLVASASGDHTGLIWTSP